MRAQCLHKTLTQARGSAMLDEPNPVLEEGYRTHRRKTEECSGLSQVYFEDLCFEASVVGIDEDKDRRARVWR